MQKELEGLKASLENQLSASKWTKKAKKVGESVITMTELVLPNHTNQLGTSRWVPTPDRYLCPLSGAKHTKILCVTASVDSIDFHHPVKLGNAVSLVASVNRLLKLRWKLVLKLNFNTNFHRSFKNSVN